MEVKYVDIAAQYRSKEIRQAVIKTLNEGNFILGAAVGNFEKNFAAYCGAKYAVGVCSGTDALFLALKVLGIGGGDEVITAPNSFLATAGAILMTGAFPRFVDVSDDYNIDPEKIIKAINRKTKAIIPVHLTGNPARIKEIISLARKHKLPVVEDACQAVGAAVDGKKIGAFGDMTVFSLHPLKNLNTCGDGGVITTNNAGYYRKLLLLRNHGLINRDEAGFFAYNCRLDTLKAAVADVQLKYLDDITRIRIENAALYDSCLRKLGNMLVIPERRDGITQVFHTYVVCVRKRNELIKFLLENGIQTKIHYPIPIHLLKAANALGYKKSDFPVTEKLARQIISLPVNQFLKREEILYVVDAIFRFYGKTQK